MVSTDDNSLIELRGAAFQWLGPGGRITIQGVEHEYADSDADDDSIDDTVVLRKSGYWKNHQQSMKSTVGHVAFVCRGARTAEHDGYYYQQCGHCGHFDWVAPPQDDIGGSDVHEDQPPTGYPSPPASMLQGPFAPLHPAMPPPPPSPPPPPPSLPPPPPSPSPVPLSPAPILSLSTASIPVSSTPHIAPKRICVLCKQATSPATCKRSLCKTCCLVQPMPCNYKNHQPVSVTPLSQSCEDPWKFNYPPPAHPPSASAAAPPQPLTSQPPPPITRPSSAEAQIDASPPPSTEVSLAKPKIYHKAAPSALCEDWDQHMNERDEQLALQKEKSEYERMVNNQVLIIFWGQENTCPKRIRVQDVKPWPTLDLKRRPDVLSEIGLTVDSPIEVYSVRSGQWYENIARWVFKVEKSEQHVLIRKSGVEECLQLSEYIAAEDGSKRRRGMKRPVHDVDGSASHHDYSPRVRYTLTPDGTSLQHVSPSHTTPQLYVQGTPFMPSSSGSPYTVSPLRRCFSSPGPSSGIRRPSEMPKGLFAELFDFGHGSQPITDLTGNYSMEEALELHAREAITSSASDQVPVPASPALEPHSYLDPYSHDPYAQYPLKTPSVSPGFPSVSQLLEQVHHRRQSLVNTPPIVNEDTRDELWKWNRVYVPEGSGTWPDGMYARDMGKAFHFIDKGNEAQFQAVFPGVKWPRTTFFQQ
ncbi:hypothetical protein OE88DRAFT_1740287 [Heliocybe sulcata]|uniref:Uncharacterized protein n=1 Tax=Heliocybe sulcata TaxID=5364 RepID=A0A5C3MJ54_9AGAM|nr:hypothetical protein OE88DRAFT_1740287 [Heliocybe sulcata]